MLFTIICKNHVQLFVLSYFVELLTGFMGKRGNHIQTGNPSGVRRLRRNGHAIIPVGDEYL